VRRGEFLALRRVQSASHRQQPELVDAPEVIAAVPALKFAPKTKPG
jgi:hypothetical protein